MKLAILAACLGGNVGDLYILRSVADYLNAAIPGVELDVFPYPKRFDARVVCAEQVHLPACLTFQPHRFALRLALDYHARARPRLERGIKRFYGSHLGRVLRARYEPLDSTRYAGVVSVGGEMDVPYSFLDIHDYLGNLYDKGPKPTAYGPISITPSDRHVQYLRGIFAQVPKVGIRDPATLKWLLDEGITNVELVPDCAFLSWTPDEVKREKRGRIGLCLHTGWTGRFEEACRLVRAALSTAHAESAELVLYPTNMLEDYQLFRKLLPEFRDTPGLRFLFPATSEDLKALSRTLDLVISDRLHALLVGMLHGANIVPLLTRHKVIGYHDYLGLENGIRPEDGEASIAHKVAASATDRLLTKRLEEFCCASQRAVENFYREQLELGQAS